MKTIKYCIAWFAAMWSALVVFGVGSNAVRHGGTRGVAELAGGLAAIAIAVGVTYLLFQWAMAHGKSVPDDSTDNRP